MSSLIPGYNYDIFISYRQKDNKGDGWVSEFVEALKTELESTFKEEISVYFDINPHDGLLETHDVDESLKEKLKCLIFIPIISRTYCDPKAFAWEHEFRAFVVQASKDQLGLKIKLPNGNVTSRILPVKIHDLDSEDNTLLEQELGGALRAIEFIHRAAGVNRPLTSQDDQIRESGKVFYRDQINKVGNAIKEIIAGLNKHQPGSVNEQYEEFLSADSMIRHDKSIAVLPFVDMSPLKDQEYFCDGISEEIINALSHLENFKIISRTSSFIFKNSKEDIRDIGKQLGVNTILEGSIRKSEDRLRITAQLIKISDGSHIWSERFDRETKDVFDIQDEISLKIVEKLKVDITEEKGKERLQKRYTSNLEAHNLYLEGRFFYNKRNDEGTKKSIECFEEAIQLDKNYALPYAGLADAYVFYALGYGEYPPKEAIVKAKEAALKALEIDDQLAEAYTSLGYVTYFFEYNSALAEKYFLKAIDLNPNYFPARQWYAGVFNMTNRFEEGLKKQYEALELDPVSIQLHDEIGWTYHYMGKLDKAILQYRKVIKMDPNFAIVRFNLGLALAQKGMYEEAIEECKKGVELSGGGPIMKWGLVHVYALSGNKKPAQELVEEMIDLVESGVLLSAWVAMTYVTLGEKKPALLWLEKAFHDREPTISWIRIFLDSCIITDLLNSEPGYHALLKKIGQDW